MPPSDADSMRSSLLNHGEGSAVQQRASRLRRTGWVLAFVILGLCGITAWLWHQSKGLESRVLEAIQPHLLTDVGVGSVELTVWSSWPDVEVVMRNVRIEDALDEGSSFVELEKARIVIAWWSLLEGELEVSEIKLEKGRLMLQRTREGMENWRFWSAGGASSDFEWKVGSLQLEDVLLEGRWFSEGETFPVEWSAFCERAEVGVESGSFSEPLNGGWIGNLEAGSLELNAAGRRWLNQVGLETDFTVEVNGAVWEVNLPEAVLSKEGKEVVLDAGFVSGNGFSMDLAMVGSQIQSVRELLPEEFAPQLAGQETWSGGVDVQVVVGEFPPSMGWSRFASVRGGEEWGVRIKPLQLVLTLADEPVHWNAGTVEVLPVEGGWRVAARGLSGKAAGGEFVGDADWSRKGADEGLAIQGEFVARPSACASILGLNEHLPVGAVVQEGGSIRVDGHVKLARDSELGWTWKEGNGAGVAVDVALSIPGKEDASVWRVDRMEGKGHPLEWGIELKGVEGPGIQGGGTFSGGGSKDIWKAEMTWSFVDLDVLLASFKQGLSQRGHTVGISVPVEWDCSLEKLKWDQLSAENLRANGRLLLSDGSGSYVLEHAGFCDGRLSGEGEWDDRRVQFSGRLAGASLPELLVETRGMGQDLLLPRHVRGQIWADGFLGYHFDRKGDDVWETDMDVRVESGELVDFEWLQEIPNVLKEQPKYRLLADSEDLGRRLRRIRFEPIHTHVSLDRGLFTLQSTDIVSDAMDVGIEGWQLLSGTVDYTLDFALRDLKSSESEFGATQDDGLGHRFFLAIGGTLEEPVFGYDRSAHKSHRKEERKEAAGRLKSLIFGAGSEEGIAGDTLRLDTATDSLRQVKSERRILEDDEDF